VQTRITELLGTKYPIILGGLQWLGRSRLAAAVSNAGGFGLLTAGSFAGKDELLQEIELTRSLTSYPFGVNISLGVKRKMDEFFEAVIESGIKVVFTSGRNPEAYVPKLKAAGVKLVHVVPAVRFAVKAEKIGADAVVIVSFEAGGHPGMDDVGAMALIPRTVDSVSIPVIAAGGIADGRGVIAAMALGAEGVQLGTSFIAAYECQAHPLIKKAFLIASEVDTVMVERSFNNARRVLKTSIAEKVLELEQSNTPFEVLEQYLGKKAYVEMMEKGDIHNGVLAMGQGVGLVTEELSAAEIISRIVSKMAKVKSRLDRII